MKYEIQYSVYLDVETDEEACGESQRIYDDILRPAFKGTGLGIFPVAHVKPRRDLEISREEA